MIKWFFIAVFSFVGSSLFAQGTILEIKGTSGNLFINHKVEAKESFYSIGRLYNVPPKDLAAYNKIPFTTGLKLAQELKIPLTKNNFSQTGEAIGNQALIPLYHTLLPQETLYRLGQTYNKVSLDNLKKWNHLNSDAIGVGTQMIVGYLLVDKDLSALASMAIQEAETSVPKVEKPMEKAVDLKKSEEVSAPAKAEIIPQKKEEVAVEVKKAEVETPVVQQEVEVVKLETEVKAKPVINFFGGEFKSAFEQQTEKVAAISDTLVMAGIFKSTSGWQDGKYYCLSNDAAPGSIVKVTDRSTGKSIYAKVLDAIPDIKQNAGQRVIISNASAEELGVFDKFECSISYIK